MKYLSLTDLPELTTAADRAQRMIDATLDAVEAFPNPTIEFRLSSLKQVIDAIYRLTAIRKTMAALRANFTRNTAGLQAMTEMLRTIHAQMATLQGTIATALPRMPRMPQPDFALKLPADWNLAPKRYAPDWPPCEDEIIPEPNLPNSLGAPAPSPAGAGAPPPPHALTTNENRTTEGGHSCPPQTPLSREASPSDLGDLCESQPSLRSNISDTRSPKPDPLTALLARIPASISDPNFELPEESNNAADYAPLYNLDLVPHTRTVPTLPLSAPDLDDQIYKQHGRIVDTTVSLRADIMKLSPGSIPTDDELSDLDNDDSPEPETIPWPGEHQSPTPTPPDPPDPNALSP